MKKSPIYLTVGIVLGFSLSLLLGFVSQEGSGGTNPYHPKSTFIFDRAAYSLAYDGRTKGAIWVYEMLTPDSLVVDGISRDGFRFIEDLDVPGLLRATNKDFRGSGYE